MYLLHSIHVENSIASSGNWEFVLHVCLTMYKGYSQTNIPVWWCCIWGAICASHLQEKMSPFVSTASAATLASSSCKLFLVAVLERFCLGKVTNSIALVISSLMSLSANVTVIMWEPCSWASLLNHLMFHMQQLSTKWQLFSIVTNLCHSLANHLKDKQLGISMGDASRTIADTVPVSYLITTGRVSSVEDR